MPTEPKLCSYRDCDRPIAPADGMFCIAHSKKLANPASSMQAKTEFDKPPRLRSAIAAEKGINTTVDFANFMGGLMSDLAEGKIDANTAIAAVKAGDSLLRVVELRMRHGAKDEALELSDASGGVVAPAHLRLDVGKAK